MTPDFPDPPKQVEKQFPYSPRAHFTGVLHWLCPRCGKINRHTLSPHVWKVRCTSNRCHQTFVIGLRFGVPKAKPGPRGMMSPWQEPFPECHLFAWRSGEPVNSLEATNDGLKRSDRLR
jgi:hypothetical protein